MPRLYMIDSDTPNAFATGRNPKHAAVAVTRGIMRICNREELKGVIGHELSHVINRDILISSIAATMAAVVMMLGTWARWAALFGGFGGARRRRTRRCARDAGDGNPGAVGGDDDPARDFAHAGIPGRRQRGEADAQSSVTWRTRCASWNRPTSGCRWRTRRPRRLISLSLTRSTPGCSRGSSRPIRRSKSEFGGSSRWRKGPRIEMDSEEEKAKGIQGRRSPALLIGGRAQARISRRRAAATAE